MLTPDDPIRAAVEGLIGGRNGLVPWAVKSRGVELMGVLPGDVLLLDLNAAPVAGDVVCGQVYDWPLMSAQTVVRVYEHAPPVDLLLARSLDPALQRPLVVDGERVSIRGVFLPYRLRAERP